MAKEFAKAFYNSAKWKRCRKSYISSVFNLCERCGNPGHILHHKEKLNPININDPEVALNHSKLEYLCHDCHNKAHANNPIENKNKYEFDGNGNIVPIARD